MRLEKEDVRERDKREEFILTAMESNPASVCFSVKFSSANVFMP
jgi:hypothetical protein